MDYNQLKAHNNTYGLIVFIISIISLIFSLDTLKVYAEEGTDATAPEGGYAPAAVVSCDGETAALWFDGTDTYVYGTWYGSARESDSPLYGKGSFYLRNGHNVENADDKWVLNKYFIGPAHCSRACSPTGEYVCDGTIGDCTSPCGGYSISVQMANYFDLSVSNALGFTYSSKLSDFGTITASPQPIYFYDPYRRKSGEYTYDNAYEYYFTDSVQEVTLTAVPNDGYALDFWQVSDNATTQYYETAVITVSMADITEGQIAAIFKENKVGRLSLSQGRENPAGEAVTPEGNPFAVQHIQLSYDSEDSESSLNISGMKFTFYGTGNFRHIGKAILYRDETCSGEGTEIASAELSSDGSVTFPLSETLTPGNACYILKYLFKYDGKFGSGFTNSGDDNGTCESPTFGATISTGDIVVEGKDFEETQEITGWVTPNVYYYVEYNALKSIDRAKIVEGATSEVISVWNKPKLCEEEFTTISDEPFTIYIEGGLNIYVFSENYGNRPYIKGQGFCYGNEADKEPHLMNPVRRVYSITQ